MLSPLFYIEIRDIYFLDLMDINFFFLLKPFAVQYTFSLITCTKRVQPNPHCVIFRRRGYRSCSAYFLLSAIMEPPHSDINIIYRTALLGLYTKIHIMYKLVGRGWIIFEQRQLRTNKPAVSFKNQLNLNWNRITPRTNMNVEKIVKDLKSQEKDLVIESMKKLIR